MSDELDSYKKYHDAIIREPEDDNLRLGLAKFLLPFEPELASFIELQVRHAQREREGVLKGAFPNETSATERRLLARNKFAWARGVGLYLHRAPDDMALCTFHRGLVAHVVVEPEIFIERSDELLAQAPIRHVDFAPLPPGVLPQLLACEALAKLDSVGFHAVGLDDDAVAAIAACPWLSNCLYLDLSGNRLGVPAFRALAELPHLRQLLVVERGSEHQLDARLTWHPGEVIISDISRSWLSQIGYEGRSLEASHGYLPWLHFKNKVSRFDARWFVDQGLRPVQPRGTPVGQ